MRSQGVSAARKDSPIGIVVYCSHPEKEGPYSKVWERNLSLWYKAYKKRKQEEGGGSFLIASVPQLPKNSPELERLRQEIGFEILFPGDQTISINDKPVSDKVKTTDTIEKEPQSTESTAKPIKRRKTKKAKKEVKQKENPSNQANGKREKKPNSDKSPVIAVSKSVAGLKFLFYSPALTVFKTPGTASWKEEFQSQISLVKREEDLHFLLVQDPNQLSIDAPNIIAGEIHSLRPILLGDLPAVTLLSYSSPLRFFEGEYSFGCGANPNSLKISVLELFFRNGKMIRISEESYTLNSSDSNKSWILESN
ncbi:hypothetical protein LEP1GSC050_1215 [Leptospira broomii serovar Hurstbridge str. 5399]|uniref:Uncharacterized protein n=1 Tax=Leptospira broomii serovar Hurstbridge str. 5399 TaxID=1049789 RepID=T0F7U4_9LEPT|nr:hypothetical protein [Leptospira broomii]EQA43562.1 hypothetical protein LEP1GSC050_1215 [Leptospira broomii serovar Hurstbridge str. 5399]